MLCKTCDPHTTTPGSCPAGSVSDMACMCGAGYYGDGLVCNPCKTCDPSGHAIESGLPCSDGSTADTVVCICAAGYYGDGVFCSLCETSNGVNLCQCEAGFFGFGALCSPCKTCDPNAATSGSCPAGSGSDSIVCTCNAGYYGGGVACAICKVCDALTTTPGTCLAGSASDMTCLCIAGYYGNGTKCSACPAGTYSSRAGKGTSDHVLYLPPLKILVFYVLVLPCSLS